MDMSDEDRECMEKFREIRRAMVKDLTKDGDIMEAQPDYESSRGDEEIGTHEMLMAEVNTEREEEWI